MRIDPRKPGILEITAPMNASPKHVRRIHAVALSKNMNMRFYRLCGSISKLIVCTGDL